MKQLVRQKLRLIGHLYLVIFVFWGLYRLIFRLPDNIEEIILKPLIWLGPTFYIVFKVEKKGLASLGYSAKNFGPSLVKGLAFGALFLLVGLSLNYLENGHLSIQSLPIKEFFLPSLLLSFITAISEETVFRGYIMNRLSGILKSDLAANVISSLGFCLVHLPITIFVYRYNLPQIFIFLSLVFLSSLGSGAVFSWTKTIWASILVHVFWAWPVALLM